MNTLRELVLILSTLLWLGAGIWIIGAIVATGNVPEEDFETVAPRGSYYVLAAGVIVFVATSFLWQKKKED